MAFNAATQWEFQTTGSNTNGGGFFNATPGTSVDLALANTPATFTDLVIDAATNTKITSSIRPFTTADGGNIINITSGTGFTVQRVQILSVDGSAIATCDKAVGTAGSTGGNGKMGGALAVPTGALMDLAVAGNTVWAKQGTYTLTGNTSVSSAGTATKPIWFCGYKAMRGDNPSGLDRPFVIAAAYTFNTTSFWIAKNISVASTESFGFGSVYSGDSVLINCKCINTSTTAARQGIYVYNSCRIISCEGIATNGCGIQMGGSRLLNSYAHDSSTGIYFTGSSVVSGCISAYNFTNAIQIGNAAKCTVTFNTLVGHTTPVGKGINLSAATESNIITHNIIYGFVDGISQITAEKKDNYYDYNNIYNCTTPRSNATAGVNDITLDPQFVSTGNIGSNFCTNGADWTDATGSTPPTGWAVKTAGTFTITASGQSGDYLKIAHNGTNNNPEISFAITTEVGKSYRITYYAQKGTATNATAKVGTTSGGTEIGYTATHTDTDWNTQKSISFEATATTTYFSVGATTSTSGQYAMIDTVTIYEQGEDFTPGDNMKLDIDWTKVGL